MHDTVSDGADGSFGAVMDPEFAEQTFQVSLDGVLANKQRGSDGRISKFEGGNLGEVMI